MRNYSNIEIRGNFVGRVVKTHTGQFERGSALIAVLLILLLITILGVMALRQSLTTLSLSTNSQVRQLLVQSSDTPLNLLTQLYQTQEELANITSVDGVIGAALSPTAVPGYEYTFCYRPTGTNAFQRAIDANVIQISTVDTPTLINGGSSNGFCDLTGSVTTDADTQAISSDFGSGRQATVTQVAVTVPPVDPNATPGSSLARGTCASIGCQVPSNYTQTQTIRMTSTAMLPAFATSSLSTVQTNCLGSVNGTSPGRVSDNSTAPSVESLTDCLARYGVPANTQISEFEVIQPLDQTAAVAP